MISKELLSEVLGIHIYHCKKVAQSSIVRYKFDAIGEIRDSSINIYELAHKCKEWAKDYELHSAILDNKASCELFSTSMEEQEFYADTEPEAIFKACEFILENKRKEDERSKY